MHIFHPLAQSLIFVSDRLEEVIQTQARLIEMHIPQGQHAMGLEVPQAGSLSYGSPSEPWAVHRTISRTTLYYNDHASCANRSIASQSKTPAKNIVQTSLQSKSSTTSISSLPALQNAHNNDYFGNESSVNVQPNLSANQEQSLLNSNLDLPPYDLLYASVCLYFEHINPWCPILNRPLTLNTFFGPLPIEEADRMILYAILAITLRFSSDTRLNEHNRNLYYDSSKQKVLLYGLENCSVKALQALVILALDFVGSSNGPPGRKLLALITRSVDQLGLAVESNSSLIAPIHPSVCTFKVVTQSESDSWFEDESRRRLFWGVYLLDRYSTIATTFSFALDDKDIDRKLPCKDKYFIKNQPVETRRFDCSGDCADYLGCPQNVGAFGLYVEILAILSRIHQFLKRSVNIESIPDVEEWQSMYWKIDNELASWKRNLPAEYAYENSSRVASVTKQGQSLYSNWVQLHATYQM